MIVPGLSPIFTSPLALSTSQPSLSPVSEYSSLAVDGRTSAVTWTSERSQAAPLAVGLGGEATTLAGDAAALVYTGGPS